MKKVQTSRVRVQPVNNLRARGANDVDTAAPTTLMFALELYRRNALIYGNNSNLTFHTQPLVHHLSFQHTK
jgi:hypothetical protein